MKQLVGNIDEAVEELKHKYEEAKKLDFVFSPVAYALYHTWKKYDDLFFSIAGNTRKEDNASKVIHCRECSWYDENTKHQVRCRCKINGIDEGLVRCGPDDYCSHAEPKAGKVN